MPERYSPTPINLREKLALFSEHWSPKTVALMNDYEFKIARVEGEFVWHSHPETDETFLVIEGDLVVEMRDGEVHLGPGELFVVPRGVEHKPRATRECKIMLIEPAGTPNTGDAGGSRTAPQDVWV